MYMYDNDLFMGGRNKCSDDNYMDLYPYVSKN